MADEPTTPLEGDKPLSPGDKMKFHYIKSPLHRGLHVDGGFGGVTPSGYLHLALYSERRAIPQITVQPIEKATDETLRLGEEIREERVGREGIVRELEVSLFLDPRAAENIRKWLEEKLEVVRSVNTEKSDEQ